MLNVVLYELFDYKYRHNIAAGDASKAFYTSEYLLLEQSNLKIDPIVLKNYRQFESGYRDLLVSGLLSTLNCFVLPRVTIAFSTLNLLKTTMLGLGVEMDPFKNLKNGLYLYDPMVAQFLSIVGYFGFLYLKKL